MKKASGIGGQALMEGVMMKNGNHYACAVRKSDGTIEVDDQRTTLLGDKYKFFRVPIIWGIVTFVESLVIGVKTLTWSAGVLEDEEEEKKEEADSKQAEAEVAEAVNEAGEVAEAGYENAENYEFESEAAGETTAAPKVKKAVKKEKTKSEKTKENLLMGLLVVISIVFAVGLFMILPYFISKFLKNVIESQFVLALLEGLIRICLFVGYVAAFSCM